MKPLFLLLLAFMLLGFSYDKEINWFINFTPWVEDGLNARITELENELESANRIIQDREQVTADIAALETQRASLSNSNNQVQAALFQAQASLSKALAATRSIRVVMDSVTPQMGEVGCRTFIGTSMEPTFDNNDLVCISKDAGYLATVGVGDVVIGPGCSAGFNVIHRILREENGGWRLKGDGNSSKDPCVIDKNQVTWKMVGIAKDVHF